MADSLGDHLVWVVVVVATTAALHRCRRRRRRKALATRQAFRPSYEYPWFSWSLELMPPSRARVWLRFSPEEIRRLVSLLWIHEVPWRERVNPDPEMALCVVLARLSYPGRWVTLQDMFGKSDTWLSLVFNSVVVFWAGLFGDILRWHPQLTQQRMGVFAAAIEAAGGCGRIWSFVDGHFRGFCRPGGGQRVQQRLYSGHKRAHGINWQAITTPDSLVSSLTGPFAGPVNDWAMWQRSGCEDAIRKVSIFFFL